LTKVQYQYIRDEAELEKLCDRFSRIQTFALDTEFVRERTFYPQAGLLQLSDGEQIYLVDPVSCESLDSFIQLLENPFVCKVMHSASEDIDLFRSLGAQQLANFYDTQIAASWLGSGLSLSLQKLVEQHASIILDKSQTRTNWLRRPLTEQQLQYAALDVEYLLDIAESQQEMIENLGFSDMLQQDNQLLVGSNLPDTELAYLSVNGAYRLNDAQRDSLQRLAAWRERVARRDDKPRPHVLKDADLITIATQLIQANDINKIGLSPGFVRRYADEVLAVLFEQNSEPSNPVVRLQDIKGGREMLKELRAAMIEISEQKNIPIEVFPSKRWLEAIIKHLAVAWYPKPNLWSGWRKELIMPVIENLKQKYPLIREQKS